MAIDTIRRLAADILNVGTNKIRIKPDGMKDVEGALTRADVRGLIEKGVIIKLRPQGRASTAKKGRRGHGHRKGTILDAKAVWMEKIRAQRKFLVALLSGGVLKKEQKRPLYRKIKSGIFRNKRAMLLYLKEAGLVARDYEPPKGAPPEKKEKPRQPKEAPEAKAEHKTQNPEHKTQNPAQNPEHKTSKGEGK